MGRGKLSGTLTLRFREDGIFLGLRLDGLNFRSRDGEGYQTHVCYDKRTSNPPSEWRSLPQPKIEQLRLSEGPATVLAFLLWCLIQSRRGQKCLEHAHPIYSTGIRKSPHWRILLFGQIAELDHEAETVFDTIIDWTEDSNGIACLSFRENELLSLSDIHVERDDNQQVVLVTEPAELNRLREAVINSYLAERLKRSLDTSALGKHDHAQGAMPIATLKNTGSDAAAALATVDEQIHSPANNQTEHPSSTHDRADMSAPARRVPDFSGLPYTEPFFYGRTSEITSLSEALKDGSVRLVVIRDDDAEFAGGIGKTALVKHWLGVLANEPDHGDYDIFAYSFYRQGEPQSSAGSIRSTIKSRISSQQFFQRALTFFGDHDPHDGDGYECSNRLLTFLSSCHPLLVLDGLEAVQNEEPSGPLGRINDGPLLNFLHRLCFDRHFSGLCVLTTRHTCPELECLPQVRVLTLGPLPHSDAVVVAKALGIKSDTPRMPGRAEALEEFVENLGCNPLALTMAAGLLTEFHNGDVQGWRKNEPTDLTQLTEHCIAHAHRVARRYEEQFRRTGRWSEIDLLYSLALFDRPAPYEALKQLMSRVRYPHLRFQRWRIPANDLDGSLRRLERLGIVSRLDGPDGDLLDVHPVVRDYFQRRALAMAPRFWRQGHRELHRYYLALCPTSLVEFASQLERGNLDLDERRKLLRREIDNHYFAVHHAIYGGLLVDSWLITATRIDGSLDAGSKPSRSRRKVQLAYLLESTPGLDRLPAVIGRWLGKRLHRGPFAELYRDVSDFDKPMPFVLASRLHQWDLRLALADHFYPNGPAHNNVFNKGLMSLAVDLATGRCLAYTGHSSDAIACSKRALATATRLRLEPFAYLAAFGAALIQINTCDLENSRQSAELAAKCALGDRARDEANAIALFVRDLQGDPSLGNAFRDLMLRHRPTTRGIYFYLQHLLRHAPIEELEDYIRQLYGTLPPRDNMGSYEDRISVLRNVEMSLWYRKARECLCNPIEAAGMIEQGYVPWPNERPDAMDNPAHNMNYHVLNCYHRIRVHYHNARAALLRLLFGHSRTNPDVINSGNLELSAGIALAKWSGYRLLEIDGLVLDAEFGFLTGDPDRALRSLELSTSLSDHLGYDWGRRDAARVADEYHVT